MEMERMYNSQRLPKDVKLNDFVPWEYIRVFRSRAARVYYVNDYVQFNDR